MPGSSSSTSRASAELMLLLMRASVPNAEMLRATTERELALLCTKFNIELPRHLQHLPTLPPVRSESEVAELIGPNASWDPMEKEPLKDRPPRKASMTLHSATGSKPVRARDKLPRGARDKLPTGAAPAAVT